MNSTPTPTSQTATEHHLTVRRTARYYTLGKLSPQTRTVWFALHGYGQLAQYFIRRFDVLANHETVIVAPEALSRFYTDGNYGKPGATWMTREDRQHEITDYVAYLNQLYDSLLGEHDRSQLTINVMGFSQGCATLGRWLSNGHVRADRVVLWAGFFPNGLADVIAPTTLAGVPVSYVYGRQDEYIEQMPDATQYLERLQTELPHLVIIPFDGKHTVERAVLASLATV
jgi:predicted esterase